MEIEKIIKENQTLKSIIEKTFDVDIFRSACPNQITTFSYVYRISKENLYGMHFVHHFTEFSQLLFLHQNKYLLAINTEKDIEIIMCEILFSYNIKRGIDCRNFQHTLENLRNLCPLIEIEDLFRFYNIRYHTIDFNSKISNIYMRNYINVRYELFKKAPHTLIQEYKMNGIPEIGMLNNIDYINENDLESEYNFLIKIDININILIIIICTEKYIFEDKYLYTIIFFLNVWLEKQVINNNKFNILEFEVEEYNLNEWLLSSKHI